jgi:hypothetical protein
VQRLARDATEVAELWEEVTQAWAAIVTVGTYAAQPEKMAQKRVILLVTARGEASEVAQMVSVLEGELMAAR